MSEDLVGIRVNGTLWEVADVDARKALETKLTTPTGGTQGQVLTRTANGYAWKTVQGGSEAVTYTAGTGIEITADNVINCTVEQKGAPVYTGSDNISISSSNVINITDKVALKSDIKTYTAGTNIAISDTGVISCTATPGGGSTYTAGNGISISGDNEISIKGVQHFDKPQDGFIGLYTDADGLHFTTNLIVTKAELSQQLGDINSILDEINGEVI